MSVARGGKGRRGGDRKEVGRVIYLFPRFRQHYPFEGIIAFPCRLAEVPDGSLRIEGIDVPDHRAWKSRRFRGEHGSACGDLDEF